MKKEAYTAPELLKEMLRLSGRRPISPLDLVGVFAVRADLLRRDGIVTPETERLEALDRAAGMAKSMAELHELAEKIP
jgi:hypothetical protein